MGVSTTLKAMSDNTRREILEMLRREGKMAAGDIAARFDMTNATISHHLAILKEAELITDDRKGKYIFYEINTSVFDDLLQWIVSMTKGDAHENNE